jgi:hypothetical protein
MPRFGSINERRHRLHEVVRLSGINVSVDGEDFPLQIKVASFPNARLQVYFLENEDLFKRKYVFADEDEKWYDDNGLAMSSRNMRLNEEARKSATAIFESLSFIKNRINNLSFFQLKAEALKILEQNSFVVDYVEMVNKDTLEPVKENEEGIIALIAATIGNVRLIDNMLMN